MVNSNVIRKKILDTLRTSSQPVSGELMSDELGFSRVALWKHIKALKEAGYTIQSGAKGYTIDTSEDYLYPWEFAEYSNKIEHFSSINSTMDVASSGNYDDGTIIVAESQNNGRGTKGRYWSSQNGGLFFTLINKKQIPAHLYLQESFRSLVILHNVMQKYFSIDVSLKWPNDILYGDKKIAGVLSESFIAGDRCKFINIGIGVNVNNIVELDEGVSLHSILNKQISRRQILHHFLDEYRDSQNAERNPVDEFKSLVIQTKQKIKYTAGSQNIYGIIEDVTQTGAAVISDGKNKIKIYPGEKSEK